jgi:hypothetical protein
MKKLTARQELTVMLDAVDRLAVDMKKKLRQKAREGYRGGLDRGSSYMVAKMLHEHVDRLTGLCPHCKALDGEHDSEENARQAIDVCNLAMMLWVIYSPRGDSGSS